MADIPRLTAGTTLFAPAHPDEKFFHVGYGFHWYSFMSGHAQAFKDAADKVLEKHLEGCANGDTLAFPVLTLYRHSIELILKELVRLGIRTGAYDLDANPCILGTPQREGEQLGRESVLIRHHLPPLWELVKQLIGQYEGESADEERQHVERLILQLDALDPDGQRLRYDRDSRTIRLDEQRYAAIPESFDIASLRDVMHKLFSYLETWNSYIVDCYSEMIANQSYEGGY